MTNKEFENLCNETEIGTTLTITMEGEEARGTFVGCAPDGVIIKVEGRTSIWPPDLIGYRKSEYPGPTYS